MKILFFGTPEIAVPYLEELIKAHTVVGAVTRPDRPAGRGRHVTPPAVKTAALKNNIPVFQPETFTPETVAALAALRPDAGVVVSYGMLIPERVFTLPALGCFNIHFSLLPKYRGAAPVQWALINGEKITGVTTFWLERTLDSGPIMIQKPLMIDRRDDAPKLFARLIPLGVAVMNETLACLASGPCPGTPQSGRHTLAPSLVKEAGSIDWNRTADEICNLIRGTKPWPGAFTSIETGILKGTTLKITQALVQPMDTCPSAARGSGLVCGLVRDHGFMVACGKGSLLVEGVHPENKKPMSAWSFIQGGHLAPGDRFHSSCKPVNKA